jgi:hypothetical protein
VDRHVEALIGLLGLALLALVVLAVYRWRQRVRARRVERWVREYLVGRYGAVPDELQVNCSDDPLWPVLVSFNAPAGGKRRSLRFSCAGPASTFSLLSEEGE